MNSSKFDFLPVDSLDSGDSESLGHKNFSEFRKKISRSLMSCPNSCTIARHDFEPCCLPRNDQRRILLYMFLASHQAPQFQSNWRLVFSWPISLWSSYCSNIMERSNFSNFSHITPFRLLHSHLFYITKDSVTNLLIIVQNISHDRDFKGRLRRIIESSEIELQKVFEAAF